MRPSETIDTRDREALRAAIGRYLDDVARPAERSAVERALMDEATAEVFAEELLLRHLLRHAPPEVPPASVVARWEAAVLGQVADVAATHTSDDDGGWFAQALDVFGWSMRGPSLAVNGSGARAARAGLSTLRHTVPGAAPRPREPLWRRALKWRPR